MSPGSHRPDFRSAPNREFSGGPDTVLGEGHAGHASGAIPDGTMVAVDGAAGTVAAH